jgi:hypothetical protein
LGWSFTFFDHCPEFSAGAQRCMGWFDVKVHEQRYHGEGRIRLISHAGTVFTFHL